MHYALIYTVCTLLTWQSSMTAFAQLTSPALARNFRAPGSTDLPMVDPPPSAPLGPYWPSSGPVPNNSLVRPDRSASRFEHLLVRPQALDQMRMEQSLIPGPNVDPPPPPPTNLKNSGFMPSAGPATAERR